MSVNVAIVGATGAVGQEFLTVLRERNFPIKNLKLLASARSAGKAVEFAGKTYVIEELTKDSFKGIDIALFSAGGSISKEYAPGVSIAMYSRPPPSPPRRWSSIIPPPSE
jgi:aspartate-semialdehyde dehydrogenase